MRILIITYFYSPMPNPRAFRWTALAEHLARSGHKIDVVTSPVAGQSREERLGQVRIYRTGMALLSWLRSLSVSTPFGGMRVRKGASTKLPGGGWRIILRRLHDFTWRKLYWPDSACPWIIPALAKARLLLKNAQYDCLITVSHPFSGHLIGLRLKRKWPQIRWIADIGDPFAFADKTPSNNTLLYGWLNYLVERKVLYRADVLSVTTEGALAEYEKIFPASAGKFRVIPPLAPDVPAAGNSRVFPSDGTIRMVFAGTLYRRIRNPGFLLRIFSSALEAELPRKIELHFFGNLNDCLECFEQYRHLIGRNLFLHGMVDQATALKAASEADILVNIGNDTPYQLPSKLVEYAGTGKPIVSFAATYQDSSAGFLREYPKALCLDQEQDDRDAAARFIEFIRSPAPIPPGQLGQWKNAFRVEALAGQYESLLAASPGEEMRQAPTTPSAGSAPKTAGPRPVILVSTPCFLPGFKAGGPIRSLANLTEYFGREFDFRVITADRDLGDRDPYPEIVTDDWQTMGNAKVRYLAPEDQGFSGLRRILGSTRADALYLNSFFSPNFTVKPLILRYLGLIPAIPVILAPRGEFNPSALAIKNVKKRPFIFLARRLGICREVIWQAASRQEAENIAGRFGPSARILVAPDPPMPSSAAKPREQPRTPKEPGRARLVFLGRIDRMKNLDGALSMLSDANGEMIFDIYGPLEDREYWDRCRSLMDRLPPHILARYRGVAEHKDVPAILNSYDFLFLPSHGESFGHAILESLAAGVPVIISDRTPWRNLPAKMAGWDLPLSAPHKFQAVLDQCAAMPPDEYVIWSDNSRKLARSYVEGGESVWEENRRLLAAATAHIRRYAL